MRFMPQPKSFEKRDAFEPQTMWGIFVGYYIAPGGLHTGDYLIDAGINQAKVHRAKEVVTSVTGSYQLPYR